MCQQQNMTIINVIRISKVSPRRRMTEQYTETPVASLVDRAVSESGKEYVGRPGVFSF